MSKEASLPDGFEERDAAWHLEKFTEFTAIKQRLGEPSPHLAIVGHMCKDLPLDDKLWLLGCYAATYCLPSAHVIWTQQPLSVVEGKPKRFARWIADNWKGIVTRTERRCVRTPLKMADCLNSYVRWMREEFPTLKKDKKEQAHAFYDRVWESVANIRYFGRYINIRLIEGLRRYCGVPAQLYDIRSIGGWSPKKCLCYLYPEHAETLLVDDKEGNALTNELAYDLLERVQDKVPTVDCYILAAMLCEYKGAFEKRHQYPGWTIDQEPLLYDKVFGYWGDRVDKDALWQARAALFPKRVLGEHSGWNGTRWEVTKVLRDHGYNWNDETYDYCKTLEAGDFARPKRRLGRRG
jgi:hypothetical protein